MTGQVIIVTGANIGIGFEVARLLCEGGNEVILACRSEEKGAAAVEKILKDNPNALASFMQLDLAELGSVRKFVNDFHETGKKLHVLVNNAGVYLSNKVPTRQFTKDNFELTMGTNHLGPFLLTNLLLDDLKTTASEAGEARIVMVTSSLHDPSVRKRNMPALDTEDIFLAKPNAYTADLAYKNAKLANILFTCDLARRLDGSNVTINSVCPGFIPTTELSRNATRAQRFFIRYVLGGLLRFTKITRTVDQGAKAIMELVTSDKLKGITGKYYRDGQEAKSSDESLDEELQKTIWELSARYCHMDGYEPLDAPIPPTPEELEEAAKAAKAAEKEKKADKEERTEAEGAAGGGDTEGAKSEETVAVASDDSKDAAASAGESAGDAKKDETAAAGKPEDVKTEEVKKPEPAVEQAPASEIPSA